MKTRSKFSVIILAILTATLISCEEQIKEEITIEPDADFCTDKNYYEAGDTVYFINKSKNAEKYSWIFNSDNPEATSEKKNPIYIYSIPNGFVGADYAVTLTCASETGNKSSVTKKVKIGYRYLDYFKINELQSNLIEQTNGDSISLYAFFGPTSNPDVWDVGNNNHSFHNQTVHKDEITNVTFKWPYSFPNVLLTEETWFVKIFMENDNGKDPCLADIFFIPSDGGSWDEEHRYGHKILQKDQTKIEMGFKFSNLD